MDVRIIKKLFNFKRSRRSSLKIFYLQYYKLKLQRLLGRKSLRIDTGTICTKNNIVTIGEEYQYREGGRLERVVVEDIRFRKYFLEVRLNFIEVNWIINVSHLMCNSSYMGMWRLWDKDHYDLEEYRRQRDDIDYEALDAIPVIYV